MTPDPAVGIDQGPGEPTRQAVQQCAEWLAACRRIGWRLEDLDFLEALWWKYHDRRGNWISATRDAR